MYVSSVEQGKSLELRDQTNRLIEIPENNGKSRFPGLIFLCLFWAIGNFGTLLGLLSRSGHVLFLVDVHGCGRVGGSERYRSEGRRPVRRPAVFESIGRVGMSWWILVQHARVLATWR